MYDDYTPENNGYLKDMKGCATYTEIKEWIKSEYGLKVSSLYVAQIKDKCGIEKSVLPVSRLYSAYRCARFKSQAFYGFLSLSG